MTPFSLLPQLFEVLPKSRSGERRIEKKELEEEEQKGRVFRKLEMTVHDVNMLRNCISPDRWLRCARILVIVLRKHAKAKRRGGSPKIWYARSEADRD